MADEKETKLEIVDIPNPLKDLENTIRDVFPKIAKIGQDMGKDLAGAIIKAYENMGYRPKRCSAEGLSRTNGNK